MLQHGRVIYAGELQRASHYLQTVCNVPPPPDGFFSLPEWLVDVTSAAEKDEAGAARGGEELEGGLNGHVNGEPAADRDWPALYAASKLAEANGRQIVRLAARSREEASSLDTDSSRGEAKHEPQGDGHGGHSRTLTRHASMPGPGRQLATLLRYRTVAHYKSPKFLAPRCGDKIVFGFLILLLYFGIGDNANTGSITSVAGLLFFVAALCGYGAASYVEITS
jgi:hypothetical protein